MSNALPFPMSNINPNAAPSPSGHAPRAPWVSRPIAQLPRIPTRLAPLPRIAAPQPPPVPLTTPERMMLARDRIRAAAEAGQRIRSYEVALDLDLSEFHFARQFRAAFGRSPHVYYDEIRAARARTMLGDGMGEGEVARKVGFRRPAELRALLLKRVQPAAE